MGCAVPVPSSVAQVDRRYAGVRSSQVAHLSGHPTLDSTEKPFRTLARHTLPPNTATTVGGERLNKPNQPVRWRTLLQGVVEWFASEPLEVFNRRFVNSTKPPLGTSKVEWRGKQPIPRLLGKVRPLSPPFLQGIVFNNSKLDKPPFVNNPKVNKGQIVNSPKPFNSIQKESESNESDSNIFFR